MDASTPPVTIVTAWATRADIGVSLRSAFCSDAAGGVKVMKFCQEPSYVPDQKARTRKPTLRVMSNAAKKTL